MSDRRKDLRPREKLQARGVEALSDYELLMAIIGTVTHRQMSPKSVETA